MAFISSTAPGTMLERKKRKHNHGGQKKSIILSNTHRHCLLQWQMTEYGENNGVISSDSDGRGQVDMVTVCPLGQEMRSVIDRMTFKNAVQIKGHGQY